MLRAPLILLSFALLLSCVAALRDAKDKPNIVMFFVDVCILLAFLNRQSFAPNVFFQDLGYGDTHV